MSNYVLFKLSFNLENNSEITNTAAGKKVYITFGNVNILKVSFQNCKSLLLILFAEYNIEKILN